MVEFPTHEVWGGFCENGDCDDPRHLEDCFSLREATQAAMEWAGQQGRYAFVRDKDEVGRAALSASKTKAVVPNPSHDPQGVISAPSGNSGMQGRLPRDESLIPDERGGVR